MAKKKAKLDTKTIGMIAIGILGVLFAVVGLFLPWFASSASSNVLGGGITQWYGLFSDLGAVKTDFPFVMIQIFGIVAAAFSIIGIVALIIKSLGIAKIGGLVKLILSALIIALGVLAIVFSFIYAGNYGGGLDFGDLARAGFSVAVGVFFTGIGSAVTGVMLLFK